MAGGIKKLNENLVASGRSFTITNSSIKDNDNFPIGALRCYPTDSGLRYKGGPNDYRLFDAANVIEPKTIVEPLIGDQEISTRTLKNSCVTTDKIADNAVVRKKIQPRAVGEPQIDTNAIITRHITDGNIVTAKLADASVTSDKIADAAVIQGKLAKDSVISLNIVSNAVTNSKIANSAVTNDKITDNTIQNSKLKDFTIQGGSETGVGKIAEKTITAFNVADKTLTGSQIKDGGITGTNIANYTINGINIARNTIETGNLKDGAVTADKLNRDAVITDKIQDKAVTKEKLADNVLDVVNNAVLYEIDAQGNSCVKIKDNTYFNVLSGDVNVNGNLTANRVYNMAYMDLAEAYIPGEELETGDPVYLHEDGKVYKDYIIAKSCYVGVVSDEYALCLGASDEELVRGDKVAVALVGKVHVKTPFTTVIGDYVMDQNYKKIGKALESKNNKDELMTNGYQKVLTLVFPH